MVVLSGALVLSSGLRRSSADGEGIVWRKLARALTVWLALVVSIAAFSWLGFVVSFALLTFYIIAVMYRRPLMLAATVGVASGAGFYLLFPLALGVSLPVGVLGF